MMQIYDLIMITVLIAAMVFGAWKGFVWQLASLASLVVSYFVALRFSNDLAPYLSGQEPLNRFLAMLLIYVGCGLMIWILFRMLSGLIDRVKLKEFDRQMGAVTGLAKGGLLCVAITFFAVSLSGDSFRQSILESRSGCYIGHFIERLDSIMPKGMHEVVHPILERLDTELHHEHAGSETPSGSPQSTLPQSTLPQSTLPQSTLPQSAERATPDAQAKPAAPAPAEIPPAPFPR
jgi:membrane protein required for colicin V production